MEIQKMTLSRLALLPLLIIALSACGSLETTAPSMLATPTMGAGEVVATQEPTAQPSPTPVPTQNAPATVAAMNMTAAADNVKAANIQATAIVDAAQIAANAVSTQAAVDLLMLEKSETGQTNRALIALTAQAVEVEGKKADAQIIEGQNKAEQLRQDGQTALIKQIMGWVVAVLGVVFVGVFLWRLATGRQAPADDSADDDESEESAEEDLSWVPNFPAGVRLDKFTEYIPLAAMVAIARGVSAGKPFTHEQWAKGSHKVVSEGKLTTLHRLMVTNTLATWNNTSNHRLGCTLNQRGVLFFKELSSPTYPPPPAPVPDAPNQPVTDTIRPTDTGLGEGGGWIVTQEKP